MPYPKASRYDPAFVAENLMGPNSMKMLEELTPSLGLQPGMRVLDLGCGKGLTSIFLAKEFDVKVFATDLWIPATENYERFRAMGLDEQIVPIHAEATALPYADAYFDAAVCIDAYQYFGLDPAYLDAHLAPLLRPAGIIAVAVPGLKEDLGDTLPAEMALSWTMEDIETLKTCEHWQAVLEQSEMVEIESLGEMPGFEETWADWLACDHEYAISDRPALEAGAGKYMNHIAMILRKK